MGASIITRKRLAKVVLLVGRYKIITYQEHSVSAFVRDIEQLLPHKQTLLRAYTVQVILNGTAPLRKPAFKTW